MALDDWDSFAAGPTTATSGDSWDEFASDWDSFAQPSTTTAPREQPDLLRAIERQRGAEGFARETQQRAGWKPRDAGTRIPLIPKSWDWRLKLPDEGFWFGSSDLPPATTPEGTLFGDLSERQYLGTAVQLGENVGLLPERAAITPQERFTPGLDAAGNLVGAVAQIATPGVGLGRGLANVSQKLIPTIGRGSDLARKALVGSSAAAQQQLRARGLEDPGETGRAALAGTAGGILAPTGIGQAITALGVDAATAVTELLTVDPMLAAKLEMRGWDGLTAEERSTVQMMLAAPVVGSVAGMAAESGSRALGRRAQDQVEIRAFQEREARQIAEDARLMTEEEFSALSPEERALMEAEALGVESEWQRGTMDRERWAAEQDDTAMRQLMEQAEMERRLGEASEQGTLMGDEGGVMLPGGRFRPLDVPPDEQAMFGEVQRRMDEADAQDRVERGMLLPTYEPVLVEGEGRFLPPEIDFEAEMRRAQEQLPSRVQGRNLLEQAPDAPVVQEIASPAPVPKPTKAVVPVEEWAPAKLQKELDKARERSSLLTREMIEAGRGRELPTETRTKTDPLSLRWQAASDAERMLMMERDRRMTYSGSMAKTSSKLRGSRLTSRSRKGGFVTFPTGETLRTALEPVVDVLARGIAAGSRAASKVGKSIKRGVAPYSGADSTFGWLRSVFKGRQAAKLIERNVMTKELREAFREKGEDVARDGYLYLTGKSDGSQLDARQRTAINNARAEIDTLTLAILNEAKRHGLETPSTAKLLETLRANIGAYATRAYEFGFDPEIPLLAKERRPDLYTKVLEQIQDADGLTPQQASDALDSILISYSHKGEKKTPSGGGVAVGASRFMKRRALSPEFRELVGEITTPAAVFDRTTFDQFEILNRVRFLGEIAKRYAKPQPEGAHVFKANDLGSKGRSDLVGIGPLQDMYLDETTFNALKDIMDNEAGKLGQFYSNALSQAFREINTVWRGKTGVANVTSNAVWHAPLAGVSPFNPRNAKFYKEAAGDFWKLLKGESIKGTRLEKAFNSGAMGASGSFIESPAFKRSAREMIDEIKKPAGLTGWLNKQVTRTKSAGSRIREGGREFYRTQDLLFRYASYLKQVENGKTPRQAAEHTNLFFPDYDKIGKWAQLYSKNPAAAPFLSYLLEQPRIIANAAKYNKVGLASQVGMLAAIVGGLPALDDEASAKWERIRKRLLPGIGFGGNVPHINDEGEFGIMNLNRLHPLLSMKAMVESGVYGEQGELIGNLIGGDPVAEIFSIMAAGRNTNPNDSRQSFSALERAETVVDEIGSALTPALIPAVEKVFNLGDVPWLPDRGGSDIEDLIASFGDEPDRFGRKKTPGQAIAGLTGLNANKQFWDTAYRSQSGALNARARQFADNLIRAIDDNKRDYYQQLDSFTKYLDQAVDLKRDRAELDGAFLDALSIAPKSVTPKASEVVGEQGKQNKSVGSRLDTALKAALEKFVERNKLTELPPELLQRLTRFESFNPETGEFMVDQP